MQCKEREKGACCANIIYHHISNLCADIYRPINVTFTSTNTKTLA